MGPSQVAPSNVMRWVVSVPVLSTQSVSTRLIDSIAFCRCTSAPRRLTRSAPRAYVRVTMIARPCGTSETRTAAAPRVSAGSAPPGIARSDTATGIAVNATNPATVQIITAISCWRGVRWSCRASLASESRCPARLAVPTAVASYRTVPETTALPDQTSSPGALGIASDSPVSSDSSTSARPPPTITPSSTTWSPRRATSRSPTTSSAGSTCRSAPSRTTLARGRVSRAIWSRERLARPSWITPVTMIPMTGPAVSSAST